MVGYIYKMLFTALKALSIEVENLLNHHQLHQCSLCSLTRNYIPFLIHET